MSEEVVSLAECTDVASEKQLHILHSKILACHLGFFGSLLWKPEIIKFKGFENVVEHNLKLPVNTPNRHYTNP